MVGLMSLMKFYLQTIVKYILMLFIHYLAYDVNNCFIWSVINICTIVNQIIVYIFNKVCIIGEDTNKKIQFFFGWTTNADVWASKSFVV